jgi:hypothetical protein
MTETKTNAPVQAPEGGTTEPAGITAQARPCSHANDPMTCPVCAELTRMLAAGEVPY